MAGLVAGIVYFVRIWRLPLLNQLLALILWMVLLPPFSAEYTLLHLYAPVFLLILGMTGGWLKVSKQVGYALMICIGLAFTLKSFFIVGGHMYAGQLNTVILLVLLGLVLYFPLAVEKSGQEASMV